MNWWHIAAATLEAAGNAALVVVLVAAGRRPWPLIALKMLVAAVIAYASTNLFYSLAYIGRETDLFAWWDTPAEKTVRFVQIGSMWAMLATGLETVVAARD